MAILKGYTDVIAPVNKLVNGNFALSQDRYRDLYPVPRGDAFAYSWILRRNDTTGLNIQVRTEEGVLRVTGSGNAGDIVRVSNPSMPGKPPYSMKTVAAEAKLNTGSAPVEVNARAAEAGDTNRTYTKAAMLTSNRPEQTAIDIAQPTGFTVPIDTGEGSVDHAAYGYVEIKLPATGSFDVEISNVRYIEGEYQHPPLHTTLSAEAHQANLIPNSAPSFVGPGPLQLVGGDFATDGYFGEIPGSQFIEGWELLNHCWGIGATSKADLISKWDSSHGHLPTPRLLFTGSSYDGTEDNLETSWLKFYSRGKILFVPKRPLMHYISWLHMGVAIDQIDGTPITADIGRWNSGYTAGRDIRMVCRLLTGANSNRAYGHSRDDRGKDGVQLGGNSEWNRLIYPSHTQVPSDLDTYSGGRQSASNWADFSTSDFGGNSDDEGRTIWCQERSGNATSWYVLRDFGGQVSGFWGIHSTTSWVFGFRPVLEVTP